MGNLLLSLSLLHKKYLKTSKMSGRKIALVTFTVLNYVLCMVINALGSMGYIGVGTNSTQSLKYPTAITPDNWAFAIWGIIFALQGLWVLIVLHVYFIYPTCCSHNKGSAPEKNSKEYIFGQYIDALGYPIAFVWLGETLWTFAFNYDVIWLSLIFMYGVVAALGIAIHRVLNVEPAGDLSFGYKVLLYFSGVFPTSINLGWIALAASVNTFIMVTRYGGTLGADGNYIVPESEYVAAIPSLVVVCLVVCGISIWKVCPSFALATLWGITGVMTARKSDPAVGADNVYITSWVCMGTFLTAIVISIIYFIVSSFQSKQKHSQVEQEEAKLSLIQNQS